MARVNTDSINRSIGDAGEKVTVTHYTSDQTYSADQTPSRNSEEIETFASISEPTKLDVDNEMGRITIHDKKFMFKGSIDIELGDNIEIDKSEEPFEVKQVNIHRFAANKTKKIVFASKVE